MNVEKLTKQDVLLSDLIKRRISNIEKIKPYLLNKFLSKLDDLVCETRKYLKD